MAYVCEGCAKPLPFFFGDRPVCMSCVQARARCVANRGRCTCGKKANPGPVRIARSRRWIPCRRCLGTIQQVS